MPTDIDILNKHLDRRYGRDLLGRPWFRVVWSSSQTEKRVGTFSDWYGSVFVREYVGMAEVPKYPSPDYRDRWILEKLMFIENKELWADTIKGVYEPVWVFRGKDNAYVRPTIKTVDFTIAMMFTPKQKLSQSDIDDEEEKSLQDDIAANLGFFDEKYGGDLAAALHQREAIVVPTVIGVK